MDRARVELAAREGWWIAQVAAMAVAATVTALWRRMVGAR